MRQVYIRVRGSERSQHSGNGYFVQLENKLTLALPTPPHKRHNGEENMRLLILDVFLLSVCISAIYTVCGSEKKLEWMNV